MAVEELNPIQTRTNIVATLGPASNSPQMIEKLILAGVDVFRLNMAHGNRDVHTENVGNIRQVAGKLNRPTGILVDLAGPKIRLGALYEDPTVCQEGHDYRFRRGEQADEPYVLTANYDRLVDELSVGDRVMLADGTVTLVVIEKHEHEAVCRVVAGGEIRTRQGINLPGTKLSLSALTPEDRDNAAWAAEQAVDFIGLSFVRSPQDIKMLRDLLESAGCNSGIVAKIEKPEAIEALEEVVQAADGVMVARGDLGVEIDVAEMPVVQKRIIQMANRYYKPVIVATQMLESMHHSRRPTRAEVTDVANAILDGADCCMLSGETAVGEFPTDTVRMMKRIMLKTEAVYKDSPPLPPPDMQRVMVQRTSAAVIYGASRIAELVGAKLVVVNSRSGKTALAKSKLRNYIPTIGVSPSQETLRKMSLYWGITPLPDAPAEEGGPRLRDFIDEWGKAQGVLGTGDRVVFVTGAGIRPTARNLVVVHEVE